MRTSMKIAAYAGGLAVAFGGAVGVGNLTGSPIDRPEKQDDHDMAGEAMTEGDATTEEAGTSAGTASEAAELPGGLQVSEAGYTLSPINAPGSAGAAGELSFAILGPDGEPVTEFTEAHEKDLHLIVVRNDTGEFRHVHPALDANGTWSIDWKWATGGTYRVFADFEPTALGDGLTLARTVDVDGNYQPVPLPEDTAVAEVDGYTVSVTGDLVAGETSEVIATVERNGKPVTNLQPYLGAYGHLVALRDGDLAYVHVHPEGEPGDGVTEPGPDVTFYVEAPTAGTYRLFLDFQVGGKVRTADFTLTAAASDEPAESGGNDGSNDDAGGDGGTDDSGDDGTSGDDGGDDAGAHDDDGGHG